jgi:hypothetical protein
MTKHAPHSLRPDPASLPASSPLADTPSHANDPREACGAALLEAVYPGRVRSRETRVSLFWNATAIVRDPCGHRRRRNGRGVSRKGYQIAAGCSDQSIAASFCKRSGSHGAIRAARPRCWPFSTIRLWRPFMASKTGAGMVAGGRGDAVAPSVHRHQAAVRAAGSRGARLCARARRATIRSWLPSPHACLPIRDMATIRPSGWRRCFLTRPQGEEFASSTTKRPSQRN